MVLYVAFMVATLSPVWRRRVQPTWDAHDYYFPAFALGTEALRSGTLRLWDPYTACGIPAFAEPQSLLLNPIALASARRAFSASSDITSRRRRAF